MKTVVVGDIAHDDTDGQILDFAMKATGESRPSLFGWHLVRFDTTATATLHTD
jgi:hypothetical protein